MKTKKDLSKSLVEPIKTFKAMYKAAKVSQWDRKKVPSILRNKKYRQIIVPAIKEYNKWLEQEVIKRTKTKK